MIVQYMSQCTRMAPCVRVVLICVACSCPKVVQPYGEGPFSLGSDLSSTAKSGSFIQFSPETSPHCQRYAIAQHGNPVGNADALTQAFTVGVKLTGRLRRLAGESRWPCIVVSIRSSSPHAWWYLIPPPASADHKSLHCGELALEPDVSVAGLDAIAMKLNLSLPIGFSMISARLQHDHAYQWPPAHESQAWVWVANVGDASWQEMAGALQESYSAVRKDDEGEREQLLRVAVENARWYDQFRLHEYLTLRDGKTRFLDFLDPELVVALQDGSPRALWQILRGSDHHTRCSFAGSSGSAPACQGGVYTLPILRPEVSKHLIEEIDHAKRSAVGPNFSVPTNFGDVRLEHTGIILDELGLGQLAKQLVVQVLSPLARLLHADWAPWSFDSYHAFSIHKGVGGGESETQENRRSHMDVCESSMNICLGSQGFLGSSVTFGAPPGASKGFNFANASDNGVHVDNIPGRAFVNLCQHYHGVNPIVSGQRHALVVRAMSSQFRRSPAEGFFEKCMVQSSRLPMNAGGLEPNSFFDEVGSEHLDDQQNWEEL